MVFSEVAIINSRQTFHQIRTKEKLGGNILSWLMLRLVWWRGGTEANWS